MEGYLSKKKKGNALQQGRWVTRYFKAIGNHMCYSEKREPYKVIGSFPLDEVANARPDPRGKGEPHIFELTLQGGRCYYLRAESEAEASAWRKYFLSFKHGSSPSSLSPSSSGFRFCSTAWTNEPTPGGDAGSRSPRAGKWGAYASPGAILSAFAHRLWAMATLQSGESGISNGWMPPVR